MHELIAFLRDRCDEDERIAEAATHYHLIRVESRSQAEEDHARRHDPARVLADTAAKRLLLEYIASPNHFCPHPEDRDAYFWEGGERQYYVIPCGCLRALALPYADHPKFREEWKP